MTNLIGALVQITALAVYSLFYFINFASEIVVYYYVNLYCFGSTFWP